MLIINFIIYYFILFYYNFIFFYINILNFEFFWSINQRRDDVVKRRQNVKDTSAKRKAELEASHTYQVELIFSPKLPICWPLAKFLFLK